jgi:tRNA-Thr(GGU) m(6)t(6)A37 methyltransferase TsaA
MTDYPAIQFHPIGVIHSPHLEKEKTPIQPVFAQEYEGTVEVFPEFEDGLADIDGFSHLILIYHFHRAPPVQMRVKPFLQDVERGLFATRTPGRPNPIGLSIVELLKRDGNILHISGIDVLDGTPLLDIKPYVARFDRKEAVRSGWQDEVDGETAQRRGRRDAG